MRSATESCSCGAKISIDARSVSELRDRLNDWRTGHRHAEPAVAAPHHAEGNNFAVTERKSDTTAHELDVEARPGPYGRAISLRWQP